MNAQTKLNFKFKFYLNFIYTNFISSHGIGQMCSVVSHNAMPLMYSMHTENNIYILQKKSKQ